MKFKLRTANTVFNKDSLKEMEDYNRIKYLGFIFTESKKYFMCKYEPVEITVNSLEELMKIVSDGTIVLDREEILIYNDYIE